MSAPNRSLTMAVDSSTGISRTRSGSGQRSPLRSVPVDAGNPVPDAVRRPGVRARGIGGWTGLGRAQVQTRLDELLADPDSLSQGGLNLSGPAAFARTWIRRDPAAFAEFTLALHETGRAAIGDHDIDPDPDACPVTDHAALRRQFGRAVPPSTDWMVLSALRDAENAVFDYRGDPAGDISALTTPGAMTEWLEATGCWSQVQDEVGPRFELRLDHARSLAPSPDTAVLVLVNAGLLLGAGSARAFAQVPTDSLAMFPYHWLALDSRIVDGPGGVRFDAWSFGAASPYRTVTVPTATFEQHYYGAVIAH